MADKRHVILKPSPELGRLWMVGLASQGHQRIVDQGLGLEDKDHHCKCG